MKLCVPALMLLLVVPVLAVQPAHWVHNTDADFKAGKFESVVATNLGDLKLSRGIKSLLSEDPRVSAVYALAEGPDGSIYAGTGPEGLVLRLHEGKVDESLKLDDGTSIFALGMDKQGRLLIAASGSEARLLRLDKPGAEPVELLQPAGAQYIWAMAQADDGTLYLATGPNGELFQLNPDGTSKVLLKTGERNFLSLAFDGKQTLYVGTDPNGLVYRVNTQTGEMFVLYDAIESEIGALVLDKAGNVYAGASEAVEGMTGGAEMEGPVDIGRPEGDVSGMPIPAQPPANPEPPKLPDPNPSEPDPIPTGVRKAGSGQRTAGSEKHVGSSADREDRKADAKPMQEAPGEIEPGEMEPHDGAMKNGDVAIAAVQPQPASEPRPEGNAIYRIDADGFVSELFRGPVLILDMIEQDGRLIVGTGSEGLIYQIDPRAEETVILADLEPQEVMTLLPARDGKVYLGLANIGGVSAMSAGFAETGTYTSPVLDAVQQARFGKMRLDGSLPKGTSLTVATRSGNMQEPADKGWSAWSPPADAQRFLDITAPSARFLQYRLTLKTTAAEATPVIDAVDLAYQIPNLPPQIASVTVTPVATEHESAPAKQTITWVAADPNTDELIYDLHFRQGATGPWINLKDKLTEMTHEWPTRTLADGRYFVRVTASDARANALGQGKTTSRVSDAITIDNTPPAIGDLVWQKIPAGVKINLTAVDRTGTVTGVAYSVDSAEDWQAVLSSDTLFDSPSETVSFVIPDLNAGRHQISIRATDAAGNHSFENLAITVEPDAPANKPQD